MQAVATIHCMIRQKIYFTSLLASLLALSACAPSPLVKALPEGKTQINAYFGGPLIGYGKDDITIPVPLTAVSLAHGLKNSQSIYSSLYPTALVYGVIQLDAGWLQEIHPSKGLTPGLSWSPAIHGMLDVWQWQPRLYPSLDINAFWTGFNGKLFSYTGISNWFELQQSRAHSEKQPHHWIPALHAGNRWRQNAWEHGVEFKWLAPFSSNRNIVVDYKTPTTTGALGIYVSTSYRF